MSTPLTGEQLAEIRKLLGRFEFLVMMAEPSGHGRLTEVAFKDVDDIHDLCKVVASVPILLAEIARLNADVEFHMEVRMDVEKVLDKALGTEVDDGAGAGLVADVALLADRKAAADAEVERQAELLDRVEVRLTGWRHIRNRREAAAEMQAELDREVIS